MRTNKTERTHLGLSQQEKADWLGVSRSEINMAERRQRSLPTHARVKLHLLEQARQQLDDAQQRSFLPPQVDAAGSEKLLQQHHADCHTSLFAMQERYSKIEARNNKLKLRQQTLALMEICSKDCSERQRKWLDYQAARNALAVSRIDPGKLFILQHKMTMLLGEIAATEQAIANLRDGSAE